MLIFLRTLQAIDRRIHIGEGRNVEPVKDLHRIRREMRMLVEWIGPSRSVINKLIDENASKPNLQNHYHDTRDDLQFIQERLSYILSWCDSLTDTFQTTSSHQMNRVMYLLTLVTTIFVPAQFLSSVYGMNFDQIPELHWKYAYALFWIVNVFFAFVIISVFRCQRWI
jgi:Mg2+ and Co2+ transporter CorA